MSAINQVRERILKTLSDNKVGVLQTIKKNALKSKLQQVESIRKILEIDKYRLVFIGSIGAGKTTSICHLFNLLAELPKGKSDKTGVSELMVTGAGGVTVCEVIFRATDEPHSIFEIECGFHFHYWYNQ